MSLILLSFVFPLALIYLSAFGVDPIFITWIGYTLAFVYIILGAIVTLKRHRLEKLRIVLVANVFIFVSVAVTFWPLTLSFYYCEDKFELLTAEHYDRKNNMLPLRIGLFNVLKVEKNRSSTILWLSDDPSGGIAFIKNASGRNIKESYNIWNMVRLSDRWWYVIID